VTAIELLDRRTTGLDVAEVVPLVVRLRLISANSGRAVTGHAVRLWHCDRDGDVRVSDAAGWVEFGSVFPAAYPGRWPHVHFEAQSQRVVRLALPADVCEQAYADRGKVSRSDLATVFRDGNCPTMASVTGDAKRGFVATRTVSC
jgi:protocatechuate 3,4-dioxygenase beta subunit